MNAIEVRNLKFKYKDYRKDSEAWYEPVFLGLDLVVGCGEHMMIMGKAESGKTTLCRILTGSVPKYLGGKLEGSVAINGKDLSVTQTWDLVNDVAIVAQNSEEQLVCSSVEDEAAFPLQMMGQQRDKMVHSVDAALSQFGLESRRLQSVESLSGGEKKRLLLAVTKAIGPGICLLDETFDELDQTYKSILADWIRSTDRTVLLLCSRPLEICRGIFDSFGILEDGVIRSCTEEKAFETRLSSLPPFATDLSQAGAITARDLEIAKGGEFHLMVPSFELRRGEVVSLSGANGSGKSSFARALSGLDDVLKGQFSLEKKQRPVEIGYLFQNPDFQIFLTTVRDELEYPNAKGKDIDGTCSLFGLNPDGIASILSYPERKKLQAAVYYLLDRPYYILDEMESALEYEDCHRIIGLLRRHGAGVLIITHDSRIAAWASRRYVIEDCVMKEASDEH
ncbi:MAG: ATP-binding cassette domain-containing protein [Sphaerochaetaceae bacterium]|nr:ATP-binding cassette domain-containing protein [Sphaerochaetaceae bacterium]